MKYATNRPWFERILVFFRVDRIGLAKKLVILLEKRLLKSGYIFNKTMRHLKRPRLIDIAARGWEYVRYSSLELMAYEINQVRKLEGNVAELGVYKGTFASVLNRIFPDRQLYLFDTFQGFDAEDIKIEEQKGYFVNSDFSDTSVDHVMKRMPFPEQCIIKKGFFPDTAEDVDDRFVFVSLDADLYQPTIAGLEFFYPRLQQGGYILIHDFNNSNYIGIRDAVERFCHDHDLAYFPLCDVCGSVVLAK